MNSAARSLVSVVVAVRDNAETLKACLDSIVEQTLVDRELIVVDGGSTDGSLEVIQRYASSLAHFTSGQDSGLYGAWNKALRKTRGQWVCFLGADDTFADAHVLELMAPHLRQASPHYRIVYGRVALQNQKGETLYELGQPWGAVRAAFQQVMCIPHVGLMHHDSLFGEHGMFDESFQIAGDYELLLRELLAHDALFVPEVLVARVRTGGLSTNPASLGRSLREIRRAQRMHGIRRPGPLWLMACARHFLRTAIWHVLGERQARRLLDAGRLILGRPRHWTKV